MSENRLNGLALGYAHKDGKISCDEVVDIFAKLKPRQLATLDWSFEE